MVTRKQKTQTHANRIKKGVLKQTLRELLMHESTKNQQEICEMLVAKGYTLNQPTISRLLKEVGAIKMKSEKGEAMYSLPKEPPPSRNIFSLMDLVQGVTANETTVAVFTNPDCATLIASLLDHNKQELHILATTAGSDTIIIIPDSIKNTDLARHAVADFLLSRK